MHVGGVPGASRPFQGLQTKLQFFALNEKCALPHTAKASNPGRG